MSTQRVVLGSLATCSVVGLTLIATGIVSWGVRAVALFTLLGFAWLFLLFVNVAVQLYERTDGSNQ
jgi:hypothetical protein